MKLKYNLVLVLIITLGAFLRLYNLNWDQGFHLHPDERAIVIFTTPLKPPANIQEFFSSKSPWNPHFFAYGNFPLYLLKFAGAIASVFDPLNATYGQINLIGRFLSVLFDLGTLFVVFLLGKKLFNEHVGFFASFFYAVSVLPIQLSHFYAVDTILTFFVLVTLYQLIRFYEKPTRLKAVLVGFFFGVSLATKTSALVLLASIGLAIIVDFLLIFLKSPHRPHIWFPHIPKFIKRLFNEGMVIIFITAITFIIAEPYALIDSKTFWQQNLEQYRMTHDAFTFPYTLQYVGKIPYFYEVENIFLWGQGPFLATLSILGTLYFSFQIIRKHLDIHLRGVHSATSKVQVEQELILVIFFWIYFLVVGSFATGFMRYMLPLYPLLCLFAAVFACRILALKWFINKQVLFIILNSLFIILILFWPLSFMHIYTKPNTRVLASQWINENIPSEKTLAIEHWDDSLPLFGQQNYRIITLPLYDPDTPQKWEIINQKLAQTDYIIIASNRLYTPLQKLTDCQKLPPTKCYYITAQYYSKLFDGSLGFEKVADFTVFPQFSIFNFQFSINDQSADESFTVYDHPKVMIFKKILDRKSL